MRWLLWIIILIFVVRWFLHTPPQKTCDALHTSFLLPYFASDQELYWHHEIPTGGFLLSSPSFLPTYFKWKESLMTPIRTQGKCASCWAYAVADCLSDRLSVYTGGAIRKNLSVQELLSCFNRTAFPCERGGIPELAYYYTISHGLETEENYPYEQENGGPINPVCRNNDESLLNYVMIDPDRHNEYPNRVFGKQGTNRSLCGPIVTQGDIDRNIQNMKSEIFTNGPIVGTIMVYSDLYDYDGTGVYELSDNATFRGGHAHVIIGWCDPEANDEDPGVGYWICKNSWGTRHPKNVGKFAGYYFVRMGVNMCGIESRASSCIPLLNDRMKAATPLTSELYYTSFSRDGERLKFANFLKKRGS